MRSGRRRGSSAERTRGTERGSGRRGSSADRTRGAERGSGRRAASVDRTEERRSREPADAAAGKSERRVLKSAVTVVTATAADKS